MKSQNEDVPAKHPGGRPKKVRNAKCAKLVKALAQYGVPEKEMVHIVRSQGFDIGYNVLIREYAEDMDAGQAVGKSVLMQKAYELAKNGDRTLLIFFLKTRCGFKETSALEMTSPDGSMSPMDIEISFIGGKHGKEEDND